MLISIHDKDQAAVAHALMALRVEFDIVDNDRNAERYRWLRSHANACERGRLEWYLRPGFPTNGEGLDASIDAAMKAKI
jgi:hypothetical protein